MGAKRISKLINWVAIFVAIVGAIMVYGGISTCDYYQIEMNQPEPEGTWAMMFIGMVMMVISAIRLFVVKAKEANNDRL